MADKEESLPPPKKPDSFIGFLIALVVVSVVAAGAGWFVVGQLEGANATNNVQVAVSEEDDGQKDASENGEEETDHTGTSLIVLDPIIVDLQNSQRSWLRLELAIVAKKGAELDDEENKLRLVDDMVSFARTLTLQQISGPSGNLHLREDILDRARLSTGGFVESVLITSMVVE